MFKYIKKAFNYFVGFLWMFSVSAIDSESWIPTILCVLCTGYLLMLVLKHGEYYEEEAE